jgi:glycosyltransferase involved in cell wall biosynthesis
MRLHSPHMPSLTIAILTMNEAQRIERCIKSAAWADQIVVADSGSSDGTQELARGLGTQVFDYPDWRGFAEQRNRLLTHCTGDYVLFLDADEELTPALSQEIRDVVASGSQAVWEVGWEQVAFGRHLKAMSVRGLVPRLFHRASLLRFEGVVHEKPIMADADSRRQALKHRLPHHSRETIHASLLKLAQYAQLGAAKRAQAGKAGGIWRGFASALASFARLYIGQRGFLCGGAGFLHCLLVSLESFFRYVALEYDKDNLNHIVKR